MQILEPSHDELMEQITRHADAIAHLVSCTDDPNQVMHNLLDYIVKEGGMQIHLRMFRQQ